jgi:hypothetical protein
MTLIILDAALGLVALRASSLDEDALGAERTDLEELEAELPHDLPKPLGVDCPL